MIILGISAFYHDSACAILINGELIAAAQEERFSRTKHDAKFPIEAIKYCLEEAKCKIDDVDHICFYEKPLLKFERLLESYISYAPRGFKSFVKAIPIWTKEKLFIKKIIRKELSSLFNNRPSKNKIEILFTEHHQSHAASAFFPSPYKEAAILCLDGVGEWATTSVWYGKDNKIINKWNINFPHSIGLLYSAFTYFTGFKINSGEYKLMGLAPYGKPIYKDIILDNLIDVKNDGTFKLNMQYFNFVAGLTMTNKSFDKLFDCSPRLPESEITQKYMDIASSIQEVINYIVIKLARSIKKELNVEYLCLAGGVALNCVTNGLLLKENIYKDIWIQPASGDAGGAIGAVFYAYFNYLNNDRRISKKDKMKGSYLGKNYETDEVKIYLDGLRANYKILDDTKLITKVAHELSKGKIIGWFNGRMEFGPRALGARSILGDPRNSKMQKTLNLKIKYRESFRPFAPSILLEEVSNWFELDNISPYMLFVSKVKKDKLIKNQKEDNLEGLAKLERIQSVIPAVTHIDLSARIQTVDKETNPRYYALIKEFNLITNCPILVNTSFNIRGEPIVNTPEDAYNCFMNTEMDFLVFKNIILDKNGQEKNKNFRKMDFLND